MGSSIPCTGFSNGGAGLVVLGLVLSSLTRDRTCVPYTGRQILNHWTVREVPMHILKVQISGLPGIILP